MPKDEYDMHSQQWIQVISLWLLIAVHLFSNKIQRSTPPESLKKCGYFICNFVANEIYVGFWWEMPNLFWQSMFLQQMGWWERQESAKFHWYFSMELVKCLSFVVCVKWYHNSVSCLISNIKFWILAIEVWSFALKECLIYRCEMGSWMLQAAMLAQNRHRSNWGYSVCLRMLHSQTQNVHMDYEFQSKQKPLLSKVLLNMMLLEVE